MIPLSDPLPLRTTVEWGRFRTSQPLPIRYGDTNGELVQYDDARRVWVWAGHAVASIATVTVDDQPRNDWVAYNDLDSAGLPCAFVEFTQPIDEGSVPRATGQGKPHPRTGAVMTNPADVLWDLLAHVAGSGAPESDFATFRAECARRDLRVAGSITGPEAVQAVAAAICESVGAVFGALVDGRAFLWPGGDVEAFDSVVVDGTFEAGAAASLAGVRTAVVVNFDYAGGEPRKSLELDAPDAVAAFGRRVLTIEARWLTSARAAFDVATRRLAHAARPVWTITAAGNRAALRGRAVAPGQAATLAHALLPATGRHEILGVETDVAAGRITLTFAVPAGDVPRTRIVRQSEGIEALLYASAAVSNQGGVITLTLRDDAGQPYGNMQVVIDGRTIRYTDAGGRVVLPSSLMTPGAHTAEIVDGDRRFTVPVVIP